MPPTPIMLQRARAAQEHSRQTGATEKRSSKPGITAPIFGISALILLLSTTSWARRWLISGAAVESLIIICGSGEGSRIFPAIPLWTMLATLNLVYAVCSTSWLLYIGFAVACYPAIGLTCLAQFSTAADIARRGLRTLLRDLHFTRDKIAFFNLPALEIDVDVNGLLVLRGVSISLSSLTIVVHGIELGLKLADDIEISMCAEEVTISLFRRIDIGDVYGNIKGGAGEMTFAELDDPADGESVDIILDDTPLMRAATSGKEKFKSRPKLRESLTGVSYMKDTPAQSFLDNITTLSPDDTAADVKYQKILTSIRTESAIYQSRAHVRKKAAAAVDPDADTTKEMRAAICAEMQNLPSIAHPPERSVRVSTLKHLPPPHVRRFLHRLPFLLRLLLAVLSYFHVINIASISVAGSGRWLSSLLNQKIFKHYPETSGDLRRLQRRVSAWLGDANFCFQLDEIDGLTSVPMSTNFDIIAYLKFYDIIAYRTVLDEAEDSKIAQVVRLGGADATVSIPAFLLPHHEHLVPPKPSPKDISQMEIIVEDADGEPKTKQAEAVLESMEEDETHINISVHASLPAHFDQSLLNFIAALVKATKIIEFERDVSETKESNSAAPADDDSSVPDTETGLSDDGLDLKDGENGTLENDEDDPASHGLHRSSTSPAATTQGHARKDSGIKTLAKKLHTSLQASTAASGRFVRDLGQNTRDGMKRVVVAGMVNDRWIAKLVGRLAVGLQNMQGDVGYSGKIPVKLEWYRNQQEDQKKGWDSKLLP